MGLEVALAGQGSSTAKVSLETAMELQTIRR